MNKKLFKILVVDDEPDVRDVLARSLPRKLNVEVKTTGDGIEAVKLTKELKPDLVLLDIHLPGHMGWDVLREIREFDARVKVIISTGIFVVPREDEEFIVQQTSGYMMKPVSIDEICEKIVEVLGSDVVRT